METEHKHAVHYILMLLNGSLTWQRRKNIMLLIKKKGEKRGKKGKRCSTPQAKSYHSASTLHIPCSTLLLQEIKFASNNVAIQSVDQHNPLKLLHCGAFYSTREITAHLLNKPVYQRLHLAAFLAQKDCQELANLRRDCIHLAVSVSW